MKGPSCLVVRLSFAACMLYSRFVYRTPTLHLPSLSNEKFQLAFTMPQTVTLPVFGSAGASHPPQSSSGAPNSGSSEWHMDSGSDPMDFDLLAEYLLEDNATTNTGLGFDFK